MTRFVRFCAAFLALLGFVSFANPASAANEAVSSFVKSVGNQALAIINSADDEAAKKQALAKLFKQHVDTDFMGKFVLGTNYRQLPKDRQAHYLKLYQDFLLLTYIPRFREYVGSEFNIIKTRDDGEDVTVQTELHLADSSKPAVRVDYVLHKAGGSFKIRDIVGEGVSLITTQRSDFAGVISQNGVDYFINRLEERVNKGE